MNGYYALYAFERVCILNGLKEMGGMDWYREGCVNIIRNGVRVEKKHLELPKKLVNVIHCKNPRCITVAEPQLDAIFLLSDPATHTYRCAYCETAKDKKF